MEPLLTGSSKEGWTKPQKILCFLLIASLLLNFSTLVVVAIVGAHIFDVTSSDALCRTANSCLAKANLQFQDALVAALDPASWTRVVGDVAQLAKQLKVVNWTMETSEKCNFMVSCQSIAKPDCPGFKGDRDGKCEWVNDMCQSPTSQPWQTTKVTKSQVVGCPFFGDSSACQSAVPINGSGTCMWINYCTDTDSSNPGRVVHVCREDFSISNDTNANLVDRISQVESFAESYHTNSTGTGVTSSIDIPQYIARQLEANWTLTAETCASLASVVLQTNISTYACSAMVPDCDSWAQIRVALFAAQALCTKVQNLHLITNHNP